LFVAFTSARTLFADELSRAGAELAGARRWQPAEDFYTRALALAPAEDAYLASLGQLLIAAARSEPGDPHARLARASGAYLAAHRLSPDEPGHLVQLAAVESLVAESETATAEQRRHLETASQYLAAAAKIATRDPEVWNEAGKVRLRQENFSSAIPLFQRSLSLDDGSAETHVLYGDALVGGGRYAAALQEYETAQSLGLQNPLPAISGSALAFVRLNRPAEAVEANRRALAIAPNDYTSLKNLALLYEQLGDLDKALSFAQAAAHAAGASDKPSVAAFIDDLRARKKDDR
jgi:tetratricopeptide (TPR) repeat protein